jgi:hypothetical protein
VRLASLLFCALALCGSACRDTARFSSRGDGFEGPVVKGSFVRSGFAEDVRMCLMLDTDHLQDTPGTITSTDGRFQHTPLRPIPQIWHDPLSTLTFGDARERNLLYMATPSDGGAEDVMVVLSLMQSGTIEARLLRGAPQADAAASQAPPVFAVFTLDRRPERPCAP